MPLQLPVVAKSFFTDRAEVFLVFLCLVPAGFDGNGTLPNSRFLKTSDAVKVGLSVLVLVKRKLICERQLAIVAGEPFSFLALSWDFCVLEHFVRVLVAPCSLVLRNLYSISNGVFCTLFDSMTSTSDVAIVLSSSFPKGGSDLELFLSQGQITTDVLFEGEMTAEGIPCHGISRPE